MNNDAICNLSINNVLLSPDLKLKFWAGRRKLFEG